MKTQKRAKRLLKQYGKHIKVTEDKQNSCITLALYGYDNYNHIKKVAEGGTY